MLCLLLWNRMDTSSNSLSSLFMERTVQMTFVDHVCLILTTQVRAPAACVTYQGLSCCYVALRLGVCFTNTVQMFSTPEVCSLSACAVAAQLYAFFPSPTLSPCHTSLPCHRLLQVFQVRVSVEASPNKRPCCT